VKIIKIIIKNKITTLGYQLTTIIIQLLSFFVKYAYLYSLLAIRIKKLIMIIIIV